MWLSRSYEWSMWLAGKVRCLWLHGIAGAGKTVLVSHLVEETKKQCARSELESIVCVYYYCYHGHRQDETAPFLRWVISQLCRRARFTPDSVFAIYQTGTQPSLSELLHVLEEILHRFSRVHILLDGLDESATPRDDLLRVLGDLATGARFQKLHVIVSSRDYVDIEKAMTGIFIPISMDNHLVEADIRTYVQSKTRSDTKFQHWPPDLLATVEDILPKKATGMYDSHYPIVTAVCSLL